MLSIDIICWNILNILIMQFKKVTLLEIFNAHYSDYPLFYRFLKIRFAYKR